MSALCLGLLERPDRNPRTGRRIDHTGRLALRLWRECAATAGRGPERLRFECAQLRSNPWRNPQTGRPLQRDGRTLRQLFRRCTDPRVLSVGEREQTLCAQFRHDRTHNPETGRLIMAHGRTNRRWRNRCLTPPRLAQLRPLPRLPSPLPALRIRIPEDEHEAPPVARVSSSSPRSFTNPPPREWSPLHEPEAGKAPESPSYDEPYNATRSPVRDAFYMYGPSSPSYDPTSPGNEQTRPDFRPSSPTFDESPPPQPERKPFVRRRPSAETSSPAAEPERKHVVRGRTSSPAALPERKYVVRRRRSAEGSEVKLLPCDKWLGLRSFPWWLAPGTAAWRKQVEACGGQTPMMMAQVKMEAKERGRPSEEEIGKFWKVMQLPPFDEVFRDYFERYHPFESGRGIDPLSAYLGFPLQVIADENPIDAGTKFIGTNSIYMLCLIFLLALTQSSCTLLPRLAEGGPSYVTWTDSKRFLSVAEKLDLELKVCTQRYALVSLHVVSLAHEAPGSKSAWHENLLLLDLTNKQVTRLEPFGVYEAKFYSQRALDNALTQAFTRDRGLNYISPSSMNCLLVGPQTDQERERIEIQGQPPGWCVAWSLWMTHMTQLYPDQKPDALINRATEWLNASRSSQRVRRKGSKPRGINSLTEFIAAYANLLMKAGHLLLTTVANIHISFNKLFQDTTRSQDRLARMVTDNAEEMLLYTRTRLQA